MSEHLDYAAHFDGELYSYAIGVSKPDALFFEHALRVADARCGTSVCSPQTSRRCTSGEPAR